MLLGMLNAEKNLSRELTSEGIVVHLKGEEMPDIDALFIDWIPRGKRKSPAVVLQATVVENYVKRNVPTIIFDRFLGVTNKEYRWLRKFKTYFFEPAINYRRRFNYLPVWTPKIYDLSTYPDIETNGRGVDIGTTDLLSNKLKSFEEYYVKFGSLYPNHIIRYSSNISKVKEDEYKDSNVLKGTVNWEHTKTCILIGTQRAYEIGYLFPYVFDAMEKGCLPLLPREHRYFHLLFDTIIEKHGDVNYVLGGYKYIAIPAMVDIYERIEKYFPEMKMNHTIDVIKRCLE